VNRIYIPGAYRQVVIVRSAGCCEHCFSPAAWSPEIFEVEHIFPLGAGGATELDNLAFACPACNRYKRTHQTALDPETGQAAPLFNPRIYRWPEHFAWSADLLTIIGMTPTGRATVVALKMNRQSVQRFRFALVAIKRHPAQE
jgi:hypothetical protein